MIGYGALTAAMQAGIEQGFPRYVFAEIDHPNGMVRAWGGVGDIEWNGSTWKGVGALGRLSQVERSTELQIADRTITLRGVDPDASNYLSGSVRKRVAKFWIALLHPVTRTVVPDPYLIDEVQMDSQSLSNGEDGNLEVNITGYSGLWTLQRAQNLAWSTEQAQAAYPGDTGFDQIPSLVNKDTKWRQT